MYFSAGTSGIIHTVVVAASLFSLPALELAFGDRFGRGEARDVLNYGEATDFQSKFSSGALTRESDEAEAEETASGIDPDSSADTDSSGEFGFDEIGDSDQTTSRFGSPDEAPLTEKPTGGEGRGEEQTLDTASDGTLEDRGDTGEAEETGQATREIVIFIDLAPAPEPDTDPVELETARAAGETDTPAPVASSTDGDAPLQVAALDPDQIQETPRSGEPEGLEDGETDIGAQSLNEPNRAAAPNLGELSPPDSAAALQSETEGSLPDDIPTGDQNALAAVQTNTALDPAEVASGNETPTEATTIVEQATGQPGLPEQNNDLEASDAPLPADIEPRPELSVTVPAKGIEGFDTPAERREDPDKLVDPEDPGASLARIGGRASGLDDEIPGERGPDNDEPQSEISVADGNKDARIAVSEADEAREGILEDGVRDAGAPDDTLLPTAQVASIAEGEDFKAVDQGPRDRAALAQGPLDPLARILAEIAGDDAELARILNNPAPLETIGGNPTPGDLLTNDILQQAADAGLATAQTKLAKRYIVGLAEGRDPDELIEMLRNAAELGDVEAQLLLGALFADGRIVPKDLVQAHVFFDLAAAQGNEEANDLKPVLEREMTPREVVSSRRLAREYKLFMDATIDPRARGSGGDALREQLLDAAAAGNTAKIAELLSRGADLEGNDTAGRTAVINASWRGEQEVVDLLVELEADLNVADYEGRTAVSWAASNGHAEIVKKLLENGARPGVVDKEGLTPLMRAAWNGHETIVRLLIDAGAPISGQDDAGNSALDYAEQGGHTQIARLLRAFGA